MGRSIKSVLVARGRNAARTVARLSGAGRRGSHSGTRGNGGSGGCRNLGHSRAPRSHARTVGRPRPQVCGPRPPTGRPESVPTSSDNVGITVAGTYAVTLTGSGSASTLVLGTTSGKESLKLVGDPSSNSVLTLSAATGSQIKTKGVLKGRLEERVRCGLRHDLGADRRFLS